MSDTTERAEEARDESAQTAEQQLAEESQAEVDVLRSELEEARRRAEDYRETAARKIAELENFRRRTEQEKIALIGTANRKLLGKVLAVVDDLERAIDAAGKAGDTSPLSEGVQMIHKNLLSVLAEEGATRIDTTGAEFNVDMHEALMSQPNESPEGTVLFEVQSGWMYKDTVLRHAKVIVSAGPSN